MTATLKVGKWGSSLAIRIPKVVAEQYGIYEGSSLNLELQPRQFVMSLRKYDLDELVSQITPENRHPETDWGVPQGREEW